MGHRREVFKPRKGKRRISQSFSKKISDKDAEGAVNVALSHYTNKESADTFALSLIAAVEAINIARETEWKFSIEEIANKGISRAESKTQTRLVPFRKQIVYDLVRKSLKTEFRRGGG